jgi:hypothetical protein
LASKPVTVSHVHLQAPLHLMQKGPRDAGGLRPTTTGAFKSSDNLLLAKDACLSLADMPFSIGEMSLYRGRVHETPNGGLLCRALTCTFHSNSEAFPFLR